MPLVTVVVRSASGGITPSLTFDGDRIVIGRSDGSDVRLPDPSVSLRHASIRTQGKGYAIVDEGSTNGTTVGGVKLPPHTPRLLNSGDRVRVGRVWLELVLGQKAATPDPGLATRELALALVQSAMVAVGDDTRARVRVVEGPDIGTELVLGVDERLYVIGRAEGCDLPLADEDASREHVAVIRRGARMFLRDLGSRNGVFLGPSRITDGRDVLWRSPTMVRVGTSVLALHEPVALALAELESAADELLPDASAPPEPPPSIAEAAPPESIGVVPSAAPIAAVKARSSASGRPSRFAWTAADVAVVALALGIIVASILGLVWVLR